MDLQKANVLITGGSEGIGLGFATRFLAAGSQVLITGRNSGKLKKAARDYPGLKTYLSDISDPYQREELSKYIRSTMPGLNILINNAGIQRRVPLAADTSPWLERQQEIDTLLSGPVHLNHLLIPLILTQTEPGLIVNVTSGGAYIPQVFAPVYSACKAALHSYTMTLRHALKDTKCRVTELIPPAVQTSLGGSGVSHGAQLEEFCNTVFPRIIDEKYITVGFGQTENLNPELSGQSVAGLFDASVNRFPVKVY